MRQSVLLSNPNPTKKGTSKPIDLLRMAVLSQYQEQLQLSGKRCSVFSANSIGSAAQRFLRESESHTNTPNSTRRSIFDSLELSLDDKIRFGKAAIIRPPGFRSRKEQRSILLMLEHCKFVDKTCRRNKNLSFQLANQVEAHQISKGHSVFKFEDVSDKFYIIVRGKVSVLTPKPQYELEGGNEIDITHETVVRQLPQQDQDAQLTNIVQKRSTSVKRTMIISIDKKKKDTQSDKVLPSFPPPFLPLTLQKDKPFGFVSLEDRICQEIHLHKQTIQDIESYYHITEEGKSIMKFNHIKFLQDGDIFGEFGLLFHKPRSATILATQDTLLLSIEKHHFEDFFKEIQINKIELRRKFILESLRCEDLHFRQANLDRIVLNFSTKIKLKQGQHVFIQGDHVDSVYLIKKGEVQISKESQIYHSSDDATNNHLSVHMTHKAKTSCIELAIVSASEFLGTEDFFSEKSKQRIRGYTAKCLSDVSLFVMKRSQFIHLFDEIEGFRIATRRYAKQKIALHQDREFQVITSRKSSSELESRAIADSTSFLSVSRSYDTLRVSSHNSPLKNSRPITLSQIADSSDMVISNSNIISKLPWNRTTHEINMTTSTPIPISSFSNTLLSSEGAPSIMFLTERGNSYSSSIKRGATVNTFSLERNLTSRTTLNNIDITETVPSSKIKRMSSSSSKLRPQDTAAISAATTHTNQSEFWFDTELKDNLKHQIIQTMKQREPAFTKKVREKFTGRQDSEQNMFGALSKKVEKIISRKIQATSPLSHQSQRRILSEKCIEKSLSPKITAFNGTINDLFKEEDTNRLPKPLKTYQILSLREIPSSSAILQRPLRSTSPEPLVYLKASPPPQSDMTCDISIDVNHMYGEEVSQNRSIQQMTSLTKKISQISKSDQFSSPEQSSPSVPLCLSSFRRNATAKKEVNNSPRKAEFSIRGKISSMSTKCLSNRGNFSLNSSNNTSLTSVRLDTKDLNRTPLSANRKTFSLVENDGQSLINSSLSPSFVSESECNLSTVTTTRPTTASQKSGFFLNHAQLLHYKANHSPQKSHKFKANLKYSFPLSTSTPQSPQSFQAKGHSLSAIKND